MTLQNIGNGLVWAGGAATSAIMSAVDTTITYIPSIVNTVTETMSPIISEETGKWITGGATLQAALHGIRSLSAYTLGEASKCLVDGKNILQFDFKKITRWSLFNWVKTPTLAVVVFGLIYATHQFLLKDMSYPQLSGHFVAALVTGFIYENFMDQQNF